MSPVKSVYVPQFGSQQSSSQRGDRTMDQTEPRSQCLWPSQRGNKRAGGEKKPRSVLKVKLPNLSSNTLTKRATNGDKTSMGWSELPANKTGATLSRKEEKCVDTGSQSVGGSVLFFSQSPSSKATNKKDKAKLSILRTIYKMLEENQLIRQRLAALSQANSGCTD